MEEDDYSFLDQPAIVSISSRRKRKAETYKYSIDKIVEENKKIKASPIKNRVESDDEPEELNESISPFKALPEIPQLQDEVATDTKHEFVFTEWPRELPSPTFVLLKEDAESEDLIIQKLSSNLTNGNKLIKQQKLVIRYAHTPPNTINRYLFQLIAYETEDEALAISAFKTLEHYFTSDPDPKGPKLDKLNTIGENIDKFEGWTPSFKDFMKVFNHYGVNIQDYEKETIPQPLNVVLLTERGSDFPIKNFSMVVQYLRFCILYSKFRYSKLQVQVLISFLCKAMLDNLVESIHLVLEKVVMSLLDYFSEDTWPAECKNLLDILFESVTYLHQNYVNAVQGISTLSTRSRELRYMLTVRYLFKVAKIKAPEPSDMVPLETLQLALMSMMSIKAEERDNDYYSRLYTLIYLLDICIDDRYKDKKKKMTEFKTALSKFNQNIKEVSGYNLLVTRAKDALVFLASRLVLFVNTGESRQLSIDMLNKQ